jgi:hypothetical protein
VLFRSLLVWTADINGDSLADVLVSLGPPSNAVLVFSGLTDSTVSPVPQRMRSAIGLAVNSDLLVVDLDGDGRNDIVCLNRLNNSVEYFGGKGNGTFRPASRLSSGEEPGGFAIAPMKHDLVLQLLLTDKKEGTLRIIDLLER